MIQRLPFQYPGTADDVLRLRDLVREALAAIDFPTNREMHVLNLACGRADESGALAAALAPGRIAYYLGIDLRPDAIAEARKRWQLPGGIVDFRCGDAAAIGQMKELPPFDFIFIRHQNYWHDPAAWDRLLGNALAALSPGGLLACTSYFDREHQLLTAALQTRHAEILWNIRHLRSRPLADAPGKSVDRHLAIFRNPISR
ncbi:MAG: class I SAM-dependent methyltransferase [Akkermansiaceae bacterium]|nr:class I SAM-dependent methyltransferase [Akkermansiaceae bacterium]NJR42010.1 class I SAM-dependent methyltransferase [Akkermansiaceae bacterium]